MNDDADALPESASRKWAGASGADFVKATDDLDDVSDGTSFKRMAAAYADGSGRPTTLRRTASDVSADDIAKQDEVTNHIGGDGVSTIGNSKLDNDIAPAKIALSGATKLDTWQESGQPAKIAGSEVASNTIDTNQINGDAVTRVKIAAQSVSGDKFVEGVVDEYQTMGSSLSDVQWDALTV